MSKPIESILIVGGGTAGWMTAAYLERNLKTNDGPPVKISLVESPDIGIIGVGEATLASLKRMMSACEIDELDFMRCCNASFKNAIKFVGFHKQNETFWHPFTQLSHVNRYSLANLWMGGRQRGLKLSYAEIAAPDPAMCDHFKAPRSADYPPYQGLVNYAYHIDTIKLGRYLRSVATGRGVNHIVDTVQEVVHRENGDVAHVVTSENGDLAADLFIDCTGFRGLLINKAMEQRFIGFNDVLFNNAAVALRVPYPEDERKHIRPFTGCHAQSAGWIWDIPLYGRRGIGHVYSSDFIDAETAERQLRDFAGKEAEGLKANHIRMRIGRTERTWAGNVVAMGLAGGFIEPLESTGIYLAELGLHLLVNHFPRQDNMAVMAKAYNRHMQSLYEEIRDFICMHYCLTARDDSDYWRQCQNHPNVPDSLQEKLELWRQRLPVEDDMTYTGEIPAFSAISYTYVLIGMGYLPAEGLSYGGQFDAKLAMAVIQDRQRTTQEILNTAPDHLKLLDQIHGDPEMAAKAFSSAGTVPPRRFAV